MQSPLLGLTAAFPLSSGPCKPAGSGMWLDTICWGNVSISVLHMLAAHEHKR